MPEDATTLTLEERLSEIRAEHGDTVPVDRLAEIFGSAALITGGAQDLLVEFEKMAADINSARNDIAALNPDEVTSSFIPTATDELDAIVEATATATNAIMDVADVIEGVAGELSGDAADQLLAATTQIYEACTFQDITGQRVTKVITTLRHIENKIDAVLAVFGESSKGVDWNERTKPDEGKGTANKDEDLLNGPQLTNVAKSQDEIDALFDD